MAEKNITMEGVKRWAIIALASDDMLMETLVLKGGNAIEFLQPGVKGKLSRASYDLDFSMETDFDEDLENVVSRFEKTVTETFAEKELVVFDFKFREKPSIMRDELKGFWGGYNIEFKLITREEYARLDGNLERIRRGAIAIRPNQSSKIEIEISKYEYVGDKIVVKVDGHSIYMYSPQMIVFEKLRAICQQLPNYAKIILSHNPRPRARDFYDIHLICEQHDIDLKAPASRELLRVIFDTKKVPLSFLNDIAGNAQIHRQDWQNVLDTLPASEKTETKDFDHYLSFVLEKIKEFTSP